jgi:CBS domain-containing protein
MEPSPTYSKDAPVSGFMSSPVHFVDASALLADAHDLMSKHAMSCVAVIGRDRQPAGVVTRSDLLKVAHVRRWVVGSRTLLDLPAMCVGDVMTTTLVSVASDTPASAAAREMVDRHIHRVFVRDGDQLVGVFSTTDAMRVSLAARVADPLSSWTSSPILSVETTDELGRVIERLSYAGVGGLVVMEGGRAVGLFTQVEALEARELPLWTPVEEAMTQSMVCLPLDTALFRAAGFAVATRARRVLGVEHHEVRGIMSGLDFARAIAAAQPAKKAD